MKKETKRKIRDFFFFLARPRYWNMSNPYCPHCDKRITILASQNKFAYKGKHTAMLGNCEIWISNHPYASMTIEHPEVRDGRVHRPSRRTIYNLRKKLIKEIGHEIRHKRHLDCRCQNPVVLPPKL